MGDSDNLRPQLFTAIEQCVAAADSWSVTSPEYDKSIVPIFSLNLNSQDCLLLHSQLLLFLPLHTHHCPAYEYHLVPSHQSNCDATATAILVDTAMIAEKVLVLMDDKWLVVRLALKCKEVLGSSPTISSHLFNWTRNRNC